MKVDLIAATQIINTPAMMNAGYRFNADYANADTFNVPRHEASELAEFAGRACYQSWNRPNPETATNKGYIDNILNRKHFSVIEHGVVTFLFREISRNCTHEIVRHRHFSYSQKSQRYVNEKGSFIVVPEAVIALHKDYDDLAERIGDNVRAAQDLYEEMIDHLKKKGITGKKARQAARFILPGGTETMIVVTGNHRSWREFIEKRCIPGPDVVDPEINELATRVLVQLYHLEPNIYRDLFEEANLTDFDLTFE